MRCNRILLFAASRGIYIKIAKKQDKPNGAVQVERYNVFFRDAKGNLRQLPFKALEKGILSADGATLKLENQKNGWKIVCVYEEHNGDEKFNPVKALGRRCVPIYNVFINKKTYLSEYWVVGAEE